MVPSLDYVSDLPRLQAWKAQGDLTTVDGVEVFSIASPTFGTDKPPLIVVHGFPTASYDFWKIYPQLQERFDLFCWDLVGFGFSQKVYRTISQQIDILEALLLQKGFTSSKQEEKGHGKLGTHILSHDLGDTLVQEMLARGDDLSFDIRSIVMLNGGILPKFHRPTLGQKALLMPGIRSVAALLIANESVFGWSISKVFGPHTQPTDQEIREYHALLLCHGGETLITENIRYVTERQTFHDRWVDALKTYAANNRPFCLLDGPADPVSGRHLAEAVQVQVPNAKVVCLSEAVGHWPQVEAPEETMQAFLDFHQEISTFGCSS